MAAPAGNPVLRALDKAKTQSYHFKAIIIAGAGFFTDAYDLFVISNLAKLIARRYYYVPSTKKPGVFPPGVAAAVTGVALCGTLAGQLFFGWAGDKWGRKKVYGITLLLMIIASLGQGLSIGNTGPAVVATLCFFRFWLGFGIGGDYPLSATIMSEYSNTRTRGAFVAAVFAMQGIGYVVAALVTLSITAVFKAAYPVPDFNRTGLAQDLSCPPEADWVWRLVLMFGAVPAAFTFYARSKMPETARYTALIQRDQQLAIKDMEKVLHTEIDSSEVTKAVSAQAPQYGLFTRKFVQRHGLQLLGTCLSWFLLDVSYYSQNLFQPQIFQSVGWVPKAEKLTALDEQLKNARAQLYIALAGTVPGYWFTVVLVDRIGRKPIQMMGFFMMSAFMFVLAFDFYNLRGTDADPNSRSGWKNGNHPAFVILYSFTFFFSNFGPNPTTFIIPAELFPARLRSTCHGISSAAGKAGSIVGTFGFLYASQDGTHGTKVPDGYKQGIGYKYSFMLLAISSLLGFIVTIFCVQETNGRSLEDLSGEDEDNQSAAVMHIDGGTDNHTNDL